jgi:hypothetical protein
VSEYLGQERNPVLISKGYLTTRNDGSYMHAMRIREWIRRITGFEKKGLSPLPSYMFSGSAAATVFK